jgi:hypothetical protein
LLQAAACWEVLACVRVLVGRCRLGAWHWWENCRVLEHSLARLSSGRVPLEVIWDVQIVMG